MKPTDPHPHGSTASGVGHGPAAHHRPDDEMHNDDVAHEDSDINVTALGYSAVMLTVVCVASAALMYGAFRVLDRQAAANDPRLSPVAERPAAMPPTTTASPYFGNGPAPRLMTNEPARLEEFRAEEARALQGYGWVDEKAGVARVPIAEAKTLLLERGLPSRAEPVTDARLGTRAPAFGESSGGRRITATDAAAPPPAPAAVPATPAPHKEQ